MRGEGKQGHLSREEPPHAISRRERKPAMTCLHPVRVVPGYLHGSRILEYTCPRCMEREVVFACGALVGTSVDYDTRCCGIRVTVHVKGCIVE